MNLARPRRCIALHDRDDRGPRIETTDSAGLRIVETQTPAWSASGRGLTIDSVPIVRIGSEEDGPYAFANVRGVAVNTAGMIFVADRGVLSIKAFSPEGEFLWASGRSGSGPGEYQAFRGVESCGDTLVVGDFGLQRLTLLNDSGRVLSTRGRRPLTRHSSPLFFTCHPTGTIAYLDWGLQPSADPGPHTADAVIGASRAGEERPHQIVEFPGMDRYRYEQSDGPAHFGKSAYVAAGPDEVYVVEGDAAAVYTYNLDGDLKRIARWDAPPQRLTDEMVEAELERRVRVLPSSMRQRYRRMWDDLVRPDFLPVAAALLEASNGDLWVRKYAVQGDPPHDEIWWVLSPEGVLRGTVRVSPDFDLRRVAVNYVVGLTVDSLRVQYVEKRRLRMERRE